MSPSFSGCVVSALARAFASEASSWSIARDTPSTCALGTCNTRSPNRSTYRMTISPSVPLSRCTWTSSRCNSLEEGASAGSDPFRFEAGSGSGLADGEIVAVGRTGAEVGSTPANSAWFTAPIAFAGLGLIVSFSGELADERGGRRLSRQAQNYCNSFRTSCCC